MFWDIFYKVCIEQGTKPNPVAKQIGVSSSTVTSWKNGGIPNGETLLKLADYLGVSTDYLLGRTQEPTKISGNQIKTGNITGDNNANMNMDTNKTSQYDKTTMQVADIFQDLDVLDKAKVLNLIAELSEKREA